ncbi:5229_t:CDS:10, partial [Paraglomus brasilianum]
CGPEDKVALVSGARDKVSIWEAITPRLPSLKEYVIESSETIVDVDWLYTSCGGLVLAVASAQKITIYTRLRKIDTLVRECWIALTDIQIPLASQSVSAIAWVSSGTLVVASGNQLRCYSKWMNAAKLRQVSRMTGINEKLPTIFHAVSHVNGPLPHHHPSVLLQYLLWGKMDLVKLVLVHLYNHLKLLVDAKRPITRILPVPFDKLFEEDSPPAVTPKKSRYSELFGDDSDGDSSHSGVFEFTEEEADFLSEHLKKVSLPDLSNIEQAQLLALVNTIMQVESQKRSLDENGVRYVIFMRRYHYLNRASLSGVPRESGLSYRDMSWALHSESQDLLIEYSIAASGGKFLWKDARNHGIFLWLRNIETVRQQMELMARNQYLEDRDPTSSSLFYMALRKKKLLLGLWRTANSHKEQAKHLQFLANDFDEPKWQTAALKNAFALLGKQRYEYAAAFFLLGNKLKDAVNVCLKHLDDFQLAIAICRVYEGDDGPVLKSVFDDYVIPLAVKNKDRWLAHIVYWFMNQRDRAIKATMLPLDELHLRHYQPTSTYDTSSHDAALIVLYKQLKEKSVQTIRGASEISAEIEYTLVLRTIFAYERMGCPLLALHLLKTWVFTSDIASSEFSQISPSSPTSSLKRLRSRRRTTILDVPLNNDNIFSSGVVSADDWGWSEPQTPRSRHGSLKLVTDIFSDEPDSACNTTTLLHDKDLGMYKYSLVKRLSEQFIDGVAIIMGDLELFERKAIYQDYVEMLKQGLNNICEAAGMPVKDMEETCTEVDYYALPFYLLNRNLFSEDVTKRISTTLVNGSCAMAMLAFGPTKSRQGIDDHSMKWAKNTLLSINEWISVLNNSTNNDCDDIDTARKTTTTHDKHDADVQRNTPSPEYDPCQPSVGVQKIALASYLTLTLLSVRQQEYDIAWSCVFNATKFFHSSIVIASDLSSVVRDIIHGISDQPVATNNNFGYDNEDNAYENWSEDADRDDIFCAYDQTLAAEILQVATINHLVYLLEKFLHTCSSSIGDEIEPFITTAYLESMIEYSTNMEREVMRALPEPTYDMIPKIIRDPKQQQFWNSLRCTNHIKILLPNFIMPSTYESSSKPASVIEQADVER